MSQFSLEYFCEPLMQDPSYFSKKMFGGLAIYYRDLMAFVLVESPGDREWKQQKFTFDLWNGVLICTSHEHHQGLLSHSPGLRSHPVLGKWLYLPMSDPGFESEFEELVRLAQKNDHRIGIVPGARKRKSVKKSKGTRKKVSRKTTSNKKASPKPIVAKKKSVKKKKVATRNKKTEKN